MLSLSLKCNMPSSVSKRFRDVFAVKCGRLQISDLWKYARLFVNCASDVQRTRPKMQRILLYVDTCQFCSHFFCGIVWSAGEWSRFDVVCRLRLKIVTGSLHFNRCSRCGHSLCCWDGGSVCS